MNITERSIGSHELVVWATDQASGLQSAVAIHTAVPTPALGQLVLAPFGDATEAILDALRRSEAATLQARVFGVPLGGASAMVMGGREVPGLSGRMRAFGHVLERLDGGLWVMPGPGTTPGDLATVADRCGCVVGAADVDHLLPPESRGAIAAVRAAWRYHSGASTLAGVRTLVLGAGRVGAGVARMLAAQDAAVLIADTDPARAQALSREVDGEIVDLAQPELAECEILLPCQRGLGLRPEVVEALQCRVVAGPADRQLDDPAVAPTLAARGIVWVPEVLAGAGALLAAAREMGICGPRADADADAARIASLTAAVLAEAEATGEDPATTLTRHAELPTAPGPEPGPVRALRAA